MPNPDPYAAKVRATERKITAFLVSSAFVAVCAVAAGYFLLIVRGG